MVGFPEKLKPKKIYKGETFFIYKIQIEFTNFFLALMGLFKFSEVILIALDSDSVSDRKFIHFDVLRIHKSI